MRNIILLLTCLLSCTYIGVTQPQFPFPDSNAIWSIYETKYSVRGDTLYNSHIYKKIYQDFDSVYYPDSGYFYCMVREDSLTHRIYGEVANNFSGSELLLYDYSLGVNDTVTVYSLSFWLWMCYPVAETLKVIQVDSIYLAGQYRKRLQVDGLWMSSFIPEYWIEGIGSTFGLMWPGLSAYIAWDIPYPRLICFEQDGNLIYHDPDFIQCWAPSGVSIPENQDDDMIMIYPNPATNKVKIISPEKIISYTLYSISGNILQQAYPEKAESYIDISSYKPGIYLLSIETNQGKIVRKIGKNR